MNTPHLTPNVSISAVVSPQSPILVDRINELYRGEIFSEETARIARDRVHWMCSQCIGDSVLDVGCSQGIASILLAREGFTVTAIDTHPDSVVFARSELDLESPLVQKRLTLVQTDLASLPEQPSYDTILLGEVIEHQARPDRLLRAAKIRLNTGGRLVVTTPFALHPHPDHKVSLFPRDLIELAREIDLAVTELKVDGNYMRCVMVAPDEAGAQFEAFELLRLTEAATLDAELRLFSLLDDRSAQLKKKTDALRITQRKLADAVAELEKERRLAQNSASKAEQNLVLLKRELADVVAELVKERHETKFAVTQERTSMHDRISKLEQRLTEAKAKLLSSRATISYRLGSALLQSLKSPRALIDLPAQLLSLRREVLERRQSRERSTTELGRVTATKGKGHVIIFDAADGFADLDVTKLKALVEAEGLAPVKERLLAATAKINPKTVASRMLKLGKALSDAGKLDDDFELAEAAVSIDGSDQTLRGYFWAAQRASRFEQACQTISQLELLYGDKPSLEQQEVLDKLRKSPAFQLSVIDLVANSARERIESVPARVCYILHNSLPYSSGGYGTRSHGVAMGLTAAGHEVIVLTRPGFPVDIKPELSDENVPSEDVIDGIRYIRTLQPKRKGLSMIQYVTEAADALEIQLRVQRPELVIAASNHVTALPALIAARRLGLPFIYEVRGLWEITRVSREPDFLNSPAFAVQRLLEAKVTQLADHVFTLTEPMREELHARGLPLAKITLLPNSCDPERFVPRPRDASLAMRLGISDSVAVIGYVGTFVDYEGLDDLAQACALLKQRGVTFRLMLVGNENASGTDRGPITEQIQRIAEAEDMSDCLIMPGRVPHDEVESYYSLIDIATFPRKPLEVCEMVSPMKPLEALAMEKAVLVSSVRALTEMIVDGRTGRVFDKGSVVSLADRLQELISDPPQRLALGRQGRSWVSAERTWTLIGERMRETLSTELEASYTAPASRVAATTAAPTGLAAMAPTAVAAAPMPRWWAKVDPAFRERCAFVDIGGWTLAADVVALRDRYVQRFGEMAVARRMPSANWSRADICERTVELGSALLDVGSGLGEFVNLVALRGRHGPVTSIDIKDYDLWMDDTNTLQRIYCDLFDLDDSCAHDVVTCFEVIEHLPPQRVAEAVLILRRLARKKLYVSVPFMEGLPLYKGHFTRFDHVNLSTLFPDGRFTVFGRSDKNDVHAWILCEIEIGPIGMNDKEQFNDTLSVNATVSSSLESDAALEGGPVKKKDLQQI